MSVKPPPPGQRARLKLLAGIALLPWLAPTAGCEGDPGHGPARMHWDRDTCERCRMMVSDRKYAAQVRGGPKRKAYKFDDIGCAVFWLGEQPWAEAPDTEIWVTDYRSGEWLDARQAHYIAGKTTPMSYGFGASKEAQAGGVDFAAMRAAILARGR